ncbi:MAG: hypothetical protein AAF798_19430 [Bacteroidota bacterium]
MILDMFLGRYGNVRAFIIRLLVAAALCGAFLLYRGYQLWISGIKAEKSAVLDFMIVFNFLLMTAQIACLMVLLWAVFRPRKLVRLSPSELGQEDEELYPWSYMLAMGFDANGADIGSYRMDEELTANEIVASLRDLAERSDVPVSHWDILLKQKSVKMIDEARKLCIKHRKKAQEREAKNAKRRAKKEARSKEINLSPTVTEIT